ncbi:MAG: TlpA family protein disulfide reductase [Gemmatimonadales bacterium]
MATGGSATRPDAPALRGPARAVDASGAVRILLDAVPPTEPVRLLWLAGRPAAPDADGAGVLVVDGAGGVLRVDDELALMALPDGVGETAVASVAAGSDDVTWTVDGTGVVHGHRPIGPGRSVTASLPIIAITTDVRNGTLWAVRSSERFSYRLPGERSPLFERLRSGDTAFTPVGLAVLPEHSILADLMNAGHLLARNDTLWYAPFIRDEVLALSADGDTLWRTVRGLPQTTREPRFELDSAGRAVVNYHPVNMGLQFGGDGRLLVLSTPLGMPESGRLDELDAATGAMTASAALPTAFPTLAIDRVGRIYTLDAAAVAIHGGGQRTALPAFDLPTRDGARLRAADLEGRPTVLNFWASWCVPCRNELPALDSLRATLAVDGVPVMGMNEDRDTVAARRFLDEVAPGFPTAYGRGALHQLFGYIGLPWTILVDSEGRVVGRWIGELDADGITEIRRAVAIELRRVTAAPGTPAHGHGGGHH